MPPYGGLTGADPEIASLASRQGGRVARWQLLDLGVTRRMIERRLDRRLLLREWPGVYRVGHEAETRNGRWWGAVLLAGPDAGLSRRSAAEARGWVRPGSLIHVTTPRKIEDRADLRFQRARREFEDIDGLPVTTVAQTLLDLAATSTRRTLERALDQAELQHQLDLTSLNALMRPGAKGTTALRRALTTHHPGTTLTHSTHEEAFLSFIDRHGIPRPQLNVPITLPDGTEAKVDALWPEAKLVVEVDGPHVHGRPSAIRADHRRDLLLELAGYEVLRVTTDMLDGRLAEHLRRLIAR